MQLPPLDVLLSWPTPNYRNPETRGPALIIVNAIFITLVILTVSARLYTRIVIKRWFGIDDVFILLALLFTIGLTTVVLLANGRYGWDRHVWDIPLSHIVPTYKIAMTAKIVFTAAATFTRLSLHCFFYRLISDSGKSWFKWLVHVNVAYTIGIFISFTCIAIFFCNPIENYWVIGAPPDTCMDEAVWTLICGIINSVADLLTTITPMPLVFRLHMPLSQRIAVAMLFGMGLIVTAAGIVRTWFIYRSLFNEYDQTWYAYPLWISAAVEIDLGVICASAPVLKPLLTKIPFSLSRYLTSGISFRKSTGHTSKTLTPNASAAYSSRRKSAAPRGIPELASDKGQSYQMKHWADAEAGLMRDDSERGSEGAILDDEEEDEEEAGSQPKKGITRLLDKLRPRRSSEELDSDMTITMTSEVELQSEFSPGRSSVYERHGALHENHMPLPPLAARLNRGV
ncbi:integral membrane [Pyrenophora seminiperda CCB06]|uniref:Integral membrane n=1 Tax=Pyrenophora seminiperda CCB06 TaxID=1302712 RepID=A0A3M7M4J0_9PLEO|nr:integral membrane [Pyrenophora seminiperda CCB06]